KGRVPRTAGSHRLVEGRHGGARGDTHRRPGAGDVEGQAAAGQSQRQAAGHALEKAAAQIKLIAPTHTMKSAYELAMERLNKTSPTIKLSEQQKQDLAELDSKYAAKMAERELLVQDELRKAMEKGDVEAVEQLQKQLLSDRK